MHCKICDSIIKHIVWNNELGDWEVCPTCLEIINNAYEDPIPEDDVYDDEYDLYEMPDFDEIDEEEDYGFID